MVPLNKILNNKTLTKDNFKNPPVEMSILPFWFWNGDMDEKEMEWQLKEYKDKGIPGLFIHGRFGEKLGYLSDKWFERVKFAVKKGKEIGLDIWVYDEMNWPSGTAERQVLAKYPHLTQKYLEVVALNVDGPLFTFLEATDSRYVNTGDSKPIAAFACTEKEFKTHINNLIDLTPNLSFNKVIPWEAPEGKWRLLYFLEKEVPYYIDTLNPESTNRFIELTHEKYKSAVGEDFGSTVPGFYTDEPAMHYYHVGVDNFVVPWSGKMFKIFREKRGYDLKPFLPALYFDMGEKTAQIRYDFWRTLTEQYAETYYRRIRNWCTDNGVLFTGHVLFEEWLRLQARCEGNIFKYLKEMHIIGVDHLYPKIGTRNEPDQHVALKLGSSAAHHFGSKRLLCESMGGSYWDCTLERMKWIANWEYVLGVNLFNNHGYHYSIEGERKRDWPPSQFYHHTWWKYYSYFTTYMARLGHVLSGGKHVAKVLVMWPINSMWTNYVPQSHNKLTNLIEKNFNQLSDMLLRLHFDYDYVDEDVLSKAAIKNGKIVIAEEAYSILILPPMTHMKRSSFDIIKKFMSSGGKVIADTLLPFEFLETENDKVISDSISLFGFDPNELLDEFKGGKKAKRKTSKSNFFLFNRGKLSIEEREKELGKIINQCITSDVTINNDEVFYLHRIKDDQDIYFITNTSQKDIGNVELSFEKIGQPELWDPNTGENNPIQVFKIEDKRLCINLNFSACESHIVLIRGSVKKNIISNSNIVIESVEGKNVAGFTFNKISNATINFGSKYESLPGKNILPSLPLGNKFGFKIEDNNVLCISNWKMKLSDNDKLSFIGENYNDNNWLNVTNGAWELQLPQERDVESYPIDILYRTHFTIEEIPQNIALLIDGFSGSKYSLFINGKMFDGELKRSKLDAEIKEVDILNFIKTGDNLVAVKITVNRRTDGILDLLKIVGSFALKAKSDSYVISALPKTIKTGDWTKMGFPFYSGTGVYVKEVEIPEEYLSGKLFFEAECGEDILELVINGKNKVIPWHPYKTDITDYLVPGMNKFEIKITNTLINTLEAVKLKSGLLKQPAIVYAAKYNFKIK